MVVSIFSVVAVGTEAFVVVCGKSVGVLLSAVDITDGVVTSVVTGAVEVATGVGVAPTHD